MSNFEFLLCGVLLNHQSGQCLHVNHITSVGWWNDLACVPGDHIVSSWICHLGLPWTSSSRFPSLCFLICNETNVTNLLDDHGCIWKALSTVYGISLPESIISYFSFLFCSPPPLDRRSQLSILFQWKDKVLSRWMMISISRYTLCNAKGTSVSLSISWGQPEWNNLQGWSLCSQQCLLLCRWLLLLRDTQVWMRPSARGAHHLPEKVLDKCKGFFPNPPSYLAPLLPSCHSLTIPFSLASDSVITYHHRPETLAAVHFPLHSPCHHCSLKTPSWALRTIRCMASFPALTPTGPCWASACLCLWSPIQGQACGGGGLGWT